MSRLRRLWAAEIGRVRIPTSATFASALALATPPPAIIPTSLTVAHTADTSNAALALHPPTIACGTTTEAPAIASAACDTTTKAPAIVSTTVFVYCTSCNRSKIAIGT